MQLFEAVNGYIGESFVRLYIWAENDAQAQHLAEVAFQREGERLRQGPEYWEHVRLSMLFDGTASPFATAPSDYGWRTQEGKAHG